MADFRTHLDVVGASYSATPGVAAVRRPFPDLGGKLRAAYMFGKKYGSFAPEPIGRALGSRYDWSGRGQHIKDFGRQRPSDYWLQCIVSTMLPAVPFSTDAFINDPAVGVTLVAFHQADANAKAISLIRSLDGITTANPFFGLSLQPTVTSGRLLALHSNSGSVQSPLTPLTGALGNPAMYAGTFKNAERQAFAKWPGGSIQIGAAESTSKILTSTGRFEMGVESGADVGINRLIGVAFYRGILTSIELETIVYARQVEFQSAVASGITL